MDAHLIGLSIYLRRTAQPMGTRPQERAAVSPSCTRRALSIARTTVERRPARVQPPQAHQAPCSGKAP